MAIFEPYGLRGRQIVMCFYHPGRARERAIWLYNHLLRNRTSFLKFARRKLRKQFLGKSEGNRITCVEFLRAKIEYVFGNFFLLFLYKRSVFSVKCLRWLLGPDRQEACVLCAEVFRPGAEEKNRAIRCATPGCPGVYCDQCFSDLRNLCTLCLDPIQYGDLSDVDEEQ